MRRRLGAEEQAIFGMLLAGIEPAEIANTLGVSRSNLDSRRWAMMHKLEGLRPNPAGAQTTHGGALRRRSPGAETASLRATAMNGNTSVPERPGRRKYVPLLYRVAGVDALLLVVAVGVTIVVLDPNRVSSFRLDAEGAALLVALLLVVAINVYLVRRLVAPVQALTALARRVDLAGDGERMPVSDPASEAGELALTFNEMLARLEAERRDATGRVLAGQEAERLRIAQELHDQVGQELTAVLLGLARVEARVPEELQTDVARGPGRGSRQPRGSAADRDRAAARGARRPRAAERTRGPVRAVHRALRSERQAAARPPASRALARRELVVYRVAQEALTNVARHSGASEADLTLATENGTLTLTVTDAGNGLPDGHVPGTGMRGMHERATLIGATLTIAGDRSGGGCRVRLEVPTENGR